VFVEIRGIIVRITQNTQTHCVGKKEGFEMLQTIVHGVAIGLQTVNFLQVPSCNHDWRILTVLPWDLLGVFRQIKEECLKINQKKSPYTSLSIYVYRARLFHLTLFVLIICQLTNYNTKNREMAKGVTYQPVTSRGGFELRPERLASGQV
jgi:hypothetical protein